MNVSMVITTFDRAELLAHSLRRLAELTLPDEILVIDDGGTDNTEEVCAIAPLNLPIRYIYNHNPGPTICSMARNIGVREAQHDWIITTEPELLYVTDIVARFKELHPEHPDEVISAGHIYFAGDGWHAASPPAGVQEAVGWVAPHTALWAKAWLCAVGGWDEEFPGAWGWDDTDLLTRLRLTGHGQFIDTASVAVHQYHGLGADPNGMNEQYFLAKSFNSDESRREEIVANKGKAWGQITTRS